MAIVGAEVQKVNGESMRKVTLVDDTYFTTLKNGLLTDEEYRIPIDSISSIEPKKNSAIVKLSLRLEQLKHGYEFGSEKPHSEIVHGTTESEFKLPSKKPVIRYEAIGPGRKSVDPSQEALLPEVECSCDMCEAKFGNADNLQRHRGAAHKALVGI